MGVVHKYGGSSVATPAHIRAVAARVARAYQQGEKIAVVASAMGKSTDQLIALASQVGENICPREMDALMATGEQKTISLLAMALQNLGVPAMSFTGAQCGMLTNTNHSRAKILQIKADAVEACVAAGKVPVVAGFQGAARIPPPWPWPRLWAGIARSIRTWTPSSPQTRANARAPSPCTGSPTRR